MSRIVWLASYPKSGNTWFRAFLTNLLQDGSEPVDINQIELEDQGGMASARLPFDAKLGYNSCNLTEQEIDNLRPEYYIREARDPGPSLFVKVHDAYTFLPNGRPLFPVEATQSAFYLIRNPLDVCVSFSHHGGATCEQTAEAMSNANFALANSRFRVAEQLRQRLLTWSAHVLSWADAVNIKVHIIRYEDLKRDPEATFGAAARFGGLPSDPERVRKAIHFSRFDHLKKEEEAHGFRERIRADRPFFRKGQVGSWRETLTTEQADRLVRDHASVMKRFGYLSENGELLC